MDLVWFLRNAAQTFRAFSATKILSFAGLYQWFDEELSERRVSYESAVPELPAVAVSREPDASINSDLAGNDAVCSTCPSRPSP